MSLTLSGGTTLNDYNANLNSAAYLNSPTYDPIAAQAAFIAANGPAWSPPPAMPAFDLGVSYQPAYQPAYTVPVQSYSASVPTLPVSVGGGGGEPAINVNNTPVLQSSATMNLAPMQFPNMPNFTPEQQPGMINIGGRNYGADQLIAANPQVSFAPGVPQMDTVSDGAYGYSGTMLPAAPTTTGQPYQLGGNMGNMPEMLPAPDIAQMGMPNPFIERPAQVNYYQSSPAQDIRTLPQTAIDMLPDRNDYMPSPDTFIPPMQRQHKSFAGKLMAPIAQGVWAMRGQANARAGMLQAAEDRYKTDLNSRVTMLQTMMPGVINANREMMQQMGADSRVAHQAFNQGALAVLNFMLDQEDKKILDAAQSMELLSRAFLLPPTVIGETGQIDQTGRPVFAPVVNRQKTAMIRGAARTLGLNEADIWGLSQVQDPNAAEEQRQAAIATRQKAFDLAKLQQMLPYELGLLKAHIAETNAQAGLAEAQAGSTDTEAATNKFNLTQRQKIAKYERWEAIAKAMDGISKMIVSRETRKAMIAKADLENKKIIEETYRTRLEGQAVPQEAAARMATALATLSLNATDPNSQKVAATLLKSIEETLNHSPSTQEPLPRSQPKRPWQNAQQLPPLDPKYFNGQPLSFNNAPAIAGE